MLEAVQLQTQGLSKADVEELNFDGLRCTELTASDKALLESFPNLQFLSMNNCGLRSLSNFPSLPKLIKLELNDNKISGGLEKLLTLKDLVQVSLAGNSLRTIQDISPLLQISDLVVVDLVRCPVAALPQYRETLFARLPRLEILDGTDKKGDPASLSEDEPDDEIGLDSLEDDDLEEGSEEDFSEGDNSAEEEDDEEEDELPQKRSKS